MPPTGTALFERTGRTSSSVSSEMLLTFESHEGMSAWPRAATHPW